jgi:predicted dehydrogenase
VTGQVLNTVLVGFGEIAAGYASDPKMAKVFNDAAHIQAIMRHPAYNIAAVVDPSEQARQSARTDWQIENCLSDISQLPKDQAIDVAVLTSPSATRLEALARLPDLKAVLAEKPLGQRPGEAEAFVHECSRRDLPLQVNYWRRGAAGFHTLAGGHLASLVGEPQAAFGLYGNGLYNNGSHLVDFVRLLLGEVEAVQAISPISEIVLARGTKDKSLAFALTLDSDLVVTISPVDFSAYREVGIDIWGRDGRVAIWQEGISVQHFPLVENRGVSDADEIATDRPRFIDCPIEDAFYNMYDNIWRHLDKGEALLSPGNSALATERTLLALERSAADGGTLHQL